MKILPCNRYSSSDDTLRISIFVQITGFKWISQGFLGVEKSIDVGDILINVLLRGGAFLCAVPCS